MIDKTFISLLLGLAGVLVVAAVRPEEPEQSWDRNHPKRFWARKVAWDGDCDVVLGGDSRVVFGVAPEVLAEGLGEDRRVGNYGFLGGGYSAEYLEAIDRALDPDARDPLVVLGFSPRSVVPDITWVNEFTEAQRLLLGERVTLLFLSDFLWGFRRLALEDIQEWLHPVDEFQEVTYHFRDDGWIEVQVVDPERLTRQDRMAPITRPVDPFEPVLVEATLEAVRSWRSRDVRVVGYRNPSPGERAGNEDQLYRFDEPAFVRAFEAAGGRWLELEEDEDYVYWDSSHLDGESAKRYTQRLLEALER